MHASISLINIEPALLLPATPRTSPAFLILRDPRNDIKQSVARERVALNINLLYTAQATMFSKEDGGGRRDVFQNLTVIEHSVSPPVLLSRILSTGSLQKISQTLPHSPTE